MTTTAIPHVGQHVVAHDAMNHLRAATIVPVPRDWRDRSGSDAYTTRGEFPKCWVKFADTGSVVPWPYEDLYDDLAAAEAKVAVNAGKGVI